MRLASKTLAEWLAFLENRHTREINLGLDRIKKAASQLGLQDPSPLVITVAGTNGKGSTVALLESIYHKAGYAVASYTSPHLSAFNERIRVNQVPISDEALCAAFDSLQKTADFADLTYFEVTTLAALWYFKQFPLDLIILEVGLGGRLDAVNCIDCDQAIITTIDRDHEAMLGNTIEAIAFEKAGILRRKIPYIYADLSMPSSILKQAESLGARPFRNGIEYRYEVASDKSIQIHFQNKTTTLPQTAYHNHSLAAAFIATRCLSSELPLSLAQLEQGIQDTFLPGRQQLVLYKGRRVIIDVAHNPQSVGYLATHLAANYPNRAIHAVFSALGDKDLAGMFAAIKEEVDCWYIASLACKRAASSDALLSAAKTCNIAVDLCYNDPLLAFEAACLQAKAEDVIVVFGSFVTVSNVLKEMV